MGFKLKDEFSEQIDFELIKDSLITYSISFFKKMLSLSNIKQCSLKEQKD